MMRDVMPADYNHRTVVSGSDRTGEPT